MANEVKALEQLLSVGSEIPTIETAYALYCDYAKLLGFSVKKGTQSYFTNSLVIRMKAFHCSCEGTTDEKRSIGRIPKFRKCISRTNCRARLRVIRDGEGPYTVSVFVQEHNHAMLEPGYSYMLRSARHISLAHRTMLEVFHSSGIGVAKAFQFMEKEAKGVQNVGFTQRDAYRHMDMIRRKTTIVDADADALMKFFRDKGNSEPFFYWNYQRDDDGRLMNFFYRDSRSLHDFDYFGDVLLIDTTYRTNKYNLYCAPFVGMNHHRKNVLFGIGFLSDETTETFEWLLRAFLEAMNGKEPQVIFSDQCKALMNGIDRVFETASHRLCQWHICQKMALRFGKMKKDPEFKKLWYLCMNGCETIEEFELTWNSMMQHEEEIDAKWFRKMYKLRHRWASVFTADKFSAGIHATSRSELTNKVLKQCCSTSSTLIEFVRNYEAVQSSWRQTEGEMDALGVWVTGQVVPGNRMITHATQVYTRAVFKLFEKECGLNMCVSIKRRPVDEKADELEYIVFSGSCVSRERRVLVNLQRDEWSCSCRKWETEGIYCRHLIKILFWLNVYHIPDRYILRRWRKDANLRFYQPLANPAGRTSLNERVDKMLFINGGMRAMFDLYSRCSMDVEKSAELSRRVAELLSEFGVGSSLDGKTADEEREEEEDEERDAQRLFRNPLKANGGWLPAKRAKKNEKDKRKKVPKKRKTCGL